MGRLIEESKVLEILQTCWLNGTVAHRIIDEIKQRIKLEVPTVEAIPKSDYENRLKADMVAILTELQDELKYTNLSGLWKTNYAEGFNDSVATSVKKIQCRIDKLKENDK